MPDGVGNGWTIEELPWPRYDKLERLGRKARMANPDHLFSFLSKAWIAKTDKLKRTLAREVHSFPPPLENTFLLHSFPKIFDCVDLIKGPLGLGALGR
jgi:hypothetical protein